MVVKNVGFQFQYGRRAAQIGTKQCKNSVETRKTCISDEITSTVTCLLCGVVRTLQLSVCLVFLPSTDPDLYQFECQFFEIWSKMF